MFDLNHLRLNVLDQLHSWGVYRLKRDVRSTEGRLCPAGMEFRFEFAFYDTATGDAELHGFDEDGLAVTIRTSSWWHQELFIKTGLEWRPAPRPEPTPAPAPEESEELRIAWLQRQPAYKEAAAILSGRHATGDWGAARRDADVLCRAARALAKSNPSVARWVASRSLDFYHAWMSQATSGGEGSAMQSEVSSELAEMRRLAR